MDSRGDAQRHRAVIGVLLGSALLLLPLRTENVSVLRFSGLLRVYPLGSARLDSGVPAWKAAARTVEALRYDLTRSGGEQRPL